MESLTKRRLSIIAVWDDEHVKALLRFPRFPIRLIQQEPWQSWIGKRGGIKSIYSYLQNYQFSPTHRRLLDVVLSNPESVSDVYADRLNISRATYFSQLRELIAGIAQSLNHWDAQSETKFEDTAIEFSPASEANLPIPLTNLVGAEGTLQTLNRLITRDDVRLLTLLGPGGIGKTRLCIELARRLEKEIRFIDLSLTQDSSRLICALAQKLNIKDETLSGLKNALKNSDFLLILDNFEQFLAEKAVISELLSSSSALKILVTSRVALHIYGEHEFIVPLLPIADIESVKGQQLWAQSPAVALFVQRAQAVNPNFALKNDNVEIVTEICYQMEGLPLAIELAAYQIKYYSLPAMLAKISKSRLAFLSHESKRLPLHQQNMRATLDWSFDLLSSDLKKLLCQLSSFSDVFTASEAETFCTTEEIQQGLTKLVDHSLLEQHPCDDKEPCFKMPSIVREYVCERRNLLDYILSGIPMS